MKRGAIYVKYFLAVFLVVIFVGVVSGAGLVDFMKNIIDRTYNDDGEASSGLSLEGLSDFGKDTFDSYLDIMTRAVNVDDPISEGEAIRTLFKEPGFEEYLEDLLSKSEDDGGLTGEQKEKINKALNEDGDLDWSTADEDGTAAARVKSFLEESLGVELIPDPSFKGTAEYRWDYREQGVTGDFVEGLLVISEDGKTKVFYPKNNLENAKALHLGQDENFVETEKGGKLKLGDGEVLGEVTGDSVTVENFIPEGSDTPLRVRFSGLGKNSEVSSDVLSEGEGKHKGYKFNKDFKGSVEVMKKGDDGEWEVVDVVNRHSKNNKLDPSKESAFYVVRSGDNDGIIIENAAWERKGDNGFKMESKLKVYGGYGKVDSEGKITSGGLDGFKGKQVITSDKLDKDGIATAVFDVSGVPMSEGGVLYSPNKNTYSLSMDEEGKSSVLTDSQENPVGIAGNKDDKGVERPNSGVIVGGDGQGGVRIDDGRGNPSATDDRITNPDSPPPPDGQGGDKKDLLGFLQKFIEDLKAGIGGGQQGGGQEGGKGQQASNNKPPSDFGDTNPGKEGCKVTKDGVKCESDDCITMCGGLRYALTGQVKEVASEPVIVGLS